MAHKQRIRIEIEYPPHRAELIAEDRETFEAAIEACVSVALVELLGVVAVRSVSILALPDAAAPQEARAELRAELREECAGEPPHTHRSLLGE
jgi:hypothetical protein